MVGADVAVNAASFIFATLSVLGRVDVERHEYRAMLLGSRHSEALAR